MRTKILSLVLLVVLVAGAVALLPAMAQDEMMTHTCDSTTILLLYIAQHDYGFQPMTDVSTFEKGQYAPLFDEMMAMSGEDEMMSGEDEMTDEPMMGEEMAGEEPTMGEEMGDMTMLTPLAVPDEDPACTALRAEVEGYLYGALTMGMMEEPMG